MKYYCSLKGAKNEQFFWLLSNLNFIENHLLVTIYLYSLSTTLLHVKTKPKYGFSRRFIESFCHWEVDFLYKNSVSSRNVKQKTSIL